MRVPTILYLPDGSDYRDGDDAPPPPPEWLTGEGPTPRPGFGDTGYQGVDDDDLDEDFDSASGAPSGGFGAPSAHQPAQQQSPSPYEQPPQGKSYQQDFYSADELSGGANPGEEIEPTFPGQPEPGQATPAGYAAAQPSVPVPDGDSHPAEFDPNPEYELNSDPGFQQPSIKNFRPGEDAGTDAPPRPEDLNQFPVPDPQSSQDALQGTGLDQPQLPDLELEEQLQGPPSYVSQEFGDIPGGVDEDGKPRFVPDLPELNEDEGSLGRRVAGIAWLFFALLMTLAFYLQGRIFGMGLSLAVLSPMILGGLLMLTGTRWSGILGMILGCVYGLGFISIGLVAGLARSVSAGVGLDIIPPDVALAMCGVGICFLVASLMMLVGEPGNGRAAVGAFLLVLPQVGATAWLSTLESTWRPTLTQPTSPVEEMRYGTEEQGIFFTKPAGWAEYNWEQVRSFSPMAHNLFTKPDYYFLSDHQDMLIMFYITDPPRVRLTDIFANETLTNLETELIRELPTTNENPDTFEYKGLDFTENQYAGLIGNGRRLTITIDKARVNDKLLVIALVRDAASRRTSQEDADEALNTFFSTLEFQL